MSRELTSLSRLESRGFLSMMLLSGSSYARDMAGTCIEDFKLIDYDQNSSYTANSSTFSTRIVKIEYLRTAITLVPLVQ